MIKVLIRLQFLIEKSLTVSIQYDDNTKNQRYWYTYRFTPVWRLYQATTRCCSWINECRFECISIGNSQFSDFLVYFGLILGKAWVNCIFREWKARRWITAFCKWSGSITFTNIGHISRHSRYPTGCKTGKFPGIRFQPVLVRGSLFYSLALALSNISISSESESPSMIRPFWLSSKSYLKTWVYGYIHVVIFRT